MMTAHFTFVAGLARALLCLSLVLVLPVHAKRLALVMGNDNYTSVTKLQKAGNDATAMARELKAAGFAVQLHKDLNYRGMVKAVEVFANSITGGDEVVVFFAGHGVQIRNGSYLLPIDIEASSESEVEKTAYELNALSDKISEAKPGFSLLMVDACRDNPLKAKGRSVESVRGLSAIEPAKGQMVVYSASRGQQALDRLNNKDANPNSVFTRELIARMKQPGLKIEDLMRQVQDAVESLAKTVHHEQRPAVYNEARGHFYFFGPSGNPAATAVPASASAPNTVTDAEFWSDTKLAGNREAFEAYLEKYPQGQFIGLAKAYLSKLQEGQEPTTQAPLVSAISASSNGAKVIFSTDIYFLNNQYRLDGAHQKTLDQLLSRLAPQGGVALEALIIVGHSDTRESNHRVLSEDRANAVRSYLVSLGIPLARIYVDAKGSTQPNSDKNMAELQAKNKRVEIELIGLRKN